MKTQHDPGSYLRSNLSSLTRIAAFVALVALIVIPLFSSSSASPSNNELRPTQTMAVYERDSYWKLREKYRNAAPRGMSSMMERAIFPVIAPLPSRMLALSSSETIETLAADCSTPKSEFILGETVCAKTDGVDLNFPGGRWVNWILTDSTTVVFGGQGQTDITVNPQTFTFTPTETGTYKATIAETGDISQTPAVFTVVPVPPIATYADGCTAPKSSFSLGEVVCVKVTGAPVSADRVLQRINFVDSAQLLVDTVDVTTSSQTATFTLPTTATSNLQGVTVDNRGTWRANLVDTVDASVVLTVPITVHDPAELVSDVSISKVRLVSLQALAGATVQSVIWAFNAGPDAAQNVQFVDTPPANTTFQSLTQTSGPIFNCTTPSVGSSGSSTCTIANLNKDQSAGFVISYLVDANVGSGETTDSVTVTTTTTDRTTTDNDSSTTTTFTNPNPPVCTVTCPDNITVGTNAPGGANVTFPDAETAGTCGTGITSVPASGSFFPIGSTTVTQTTGSGQSCSFTVTVVDVAQPTINCPANVTTAAPSGQSEVTVATGTPTFTGSQAQLSSSRSDQREVSEPYPIGVTTITWTAKDQYGSSASCTQTITVTSPDAPTISCPSNKTFTAASGECTYTATAGEIGTPTTAGPNVTVTNERSDGLALTDSYPAGHTFVIWTATNGVGTASCTQTITVQATDTTPPTLHVPPDVSTTTDTCSALLDDELGVATAEDNCTASVNITRTGVPTFSCPIPGNPGRQCESFVFPTGTTTITYTATDAAGNSTTGVQHVTVTESPAVPPTIIAPAALILNTGPGATTCGTFVGDATLGSATANDNCPGVVVARTGVPAGNNFPVGDTFITYTATDKSGNTATATQKVTVVDNTAPVVTPPGNVTTYTGSGATSCGTVVNDGMLGTATATDNCPGVGAITHTGVPAGNAFSVGNTTITYSVTDAHGNSSSATQTVTVIDNTPPQISCPASITIEPTCPSGAITTYTAPVGTDNCPNPITTQTAGLASGSVFPIGATTITYSVTDANGNGPVSCSFTVTVLTPQAVIQNLIASVNASSLTGTQKNGLLAKLNAALNGINGGQTNVACNKLSEFSNNVATLISHGDLTTAQGSAWVSSANHVRNTIGCTNLGCS